MNIGPQNNTFARRIGLASVGVAFFFASALARGETPKSGFLPSNTQIGNYVAQDVMIPMRDGIKLHAEIWRPKDSTTKLPILMQRSPYGFELPTTQKYFESQFKELAKEGFIIVLEDIRGRFGSEGQFKNLRARAANAAEIDESTDTYDSIDWLVKNLANNTGKVGMFGISYMGWTTAMATIHPHPALKAISVQATPTDMFLGDDFHHNGAFRLDYAWKFAALLETDGRTLKEFSFGKDDPYDWYLKQDQLATLDTKYLGRTLPTWQNFVDHPNYDAYARAGVLTAQMPAHVTIPDLIVAGWWDQEDFYGPMTLFEHEQQTDPDNHSYLVVGPWNHGGWGLTSGQKYGPLDFGSPTGDTFRANVEVPWFKYWLKGEGKLDQPKALIFETGSNKWQRFNAWPPRKNVLQQSFYLHADGKLSLEKPNTGSDSKPDSFISDPNHPVPYRELPLKTRKTPWKEWLADDQAPFAKRPDVLTWQTDALTAPVTLRGDIAAKLYASTTGSDADWVVKLIDVYPSDDTTPAALRGRHLIIADEVFRGRFRSSFEKPAPITPNKVLKYAIDLHSGSHVFVRGHRIEVQIQSSWFPLVDRNPQTFVPNIFRANRDQFKAQRHSILHSASFPSAIAFDVAAQ